MHKSDKNLSPVLSVGRQGGRMANVPDAHRFKPEL